MSGAANRPRGRPPKGPATLSAAEHSRAYRERGARCVTLQADVLALIDRMARRHRDPTRAACVARLVRDAAALMDAEPGPRRTLSP